LANPKIRLNLIPNPMITITSGCEKTTSNLESIRRAPKKNLKYEILKRFNLVFSQTDVSSKLTACDTANIEQKVQMHPKNDNKFIDLSFGYNTARFGYFFKKQCCDLCSEHLKQIL
jgi:murein L,D-transpeptidase YafK